jgi:curved DNA-binding protein CbpA
MASSPLPPDPYEALGVSKDADLAAVRSAHRKLALKHHPDRIKDEAQREMGKDEFQKIQQAYEILCDPQRRQHYDNQVRLAELRKEAMMRGPPPAAASTTTRSYPMRPAPASAPPPTREYNEHGSYFEEVRVPRDTYDSRDPYDEVPRGNSRKHADYDRRPAPQTNKSSEKPKKASGFAGVAMAAGKFKAQAEKMRSSKAEDKRSEKVKSRERREKVETRRPANFETTDSDSDATEVRPAMKSARSKTASHFDRTERPRSSPRTERQRDLDDLSHDEKWERHHEETKAYIGKAANRPNLERAPSDAYQYWGGFEPKGSGRKSGSDSEKRPSSSKGRRSNTDDYFAPPFKTSASSPSNLRAHVEERVPSRPSTRERDRERERERERERDRDRDRERERDARSRVPPTLHRSQTTPIPKSTSRKDTAPAKGSGLKHGETHVHDSGYGSSSNPHTPELREDSPPRSGKARYPPTTSTRYQIVDPEPEVDEHSRPSRLREIHDDYGDRSNRRYHHSPESIIMDSPRDADRRREKPERPRVDTKKSKGAAMMQEYMPASPTVRRSDSGRYEERSPHDTPPISRNNSGRVDKLFAEMSPDERESSRYTRPYPADKVHVASRGDPQYSRYEYREPDERSRFRDAPRMTPRRPSVNAY